MNNETNAKTSETGERSKTTETLAERVAALDEARVAAAEHAVALARERAEYHGWNGGSSRQYADAVVALRAAQQTQRQNIAHTSEQRADHRGRGAFAVALLATLAIGAIVAALLLTLALTLAAHGGGF